ncbi:MAG: hypothetical protein A3G81_33350 [Betaproteobacteria bacterium RIFCSPLOWO2_12_FULL_65_14]|nr:MAG: hypothetical protein A3G81_33350 [Betaproteobacteria bacterium RIFCSPLOWO2_12_FULL_65_14]
MSSQGAPRGFRNRRIVGYQGLSWRSTSQRQSAGWARTVQTGFAMAPARCTTAVSIEMTRSRLAISAAVSEKSRKCALWLISAMPGGGQSASAAAVPVWRL